VGAGEEYAYETLNFVDGSPQRVGHCPCCVCRVRASVDGNVVEYLKAIGKIGVVEQVKQDR